MSKWLNNLYLENCFKKDQMATLKHEKLEKKQEREILNVKLISVHRIWPILPKTHICMKCILMDNQYFLVIRP